MNTKFISMEYDVAVFVDKVGNIVDWHYGTDFDDIDEDFWDEGPQEDGGNAGVFESAVRYVQEHGVDDPGDLPEVYLATTEEEGSHAQGPTLILLEWPIMEEDGNRNPSHIFSVHTTDDGGLVPPLPPILARRFAKAITKNNK